jgi:hypothetical protein
MRVDWIERRQGLWGLLAVVLALLSLLTTTCFYINESTSSPEKDNELLSPSSGSTKEEHKKIDGKGIMNQTPHSSGNAKEPTTKRIIEGEIFQACGISGLFFARSHSSEGIAILERRDGALFNENGEIIRGHIMPEKEPLRLSNNCFLTIKSQYEVQGHTSFEVFIERSGT